MPIISIRRKPVRRHGGGPIKMVLKKIASTVIRHHVLPHLLTKIHNPHIRSGVNFVADKGLSHFGLGMRRRKTGGRIIKTGGRTKGGLVYRLPPMACDGQIRPSKMR